MSSKEKRSLATLIYYPKEKMEIVKKNEDNMEDWDKVNLYRLIEVSKAHPEHVVVSPLDVEAVVAGERVHDGVGRRPAGVHLEELMTENNHAVDRAAYHRAIIDAVADIVPAVKPQIAMSGG